MALPLLPALPYLATVGGTLIGAGALQSAGENFGFGDSEPTGPVDGSGEPVDFLPGGEPNPVADNMTQDGGLLSGVPWLAIGGFILILVLGNTIVEGTVEELL